ncbi:MAG: DUF3180 domain-containing protein [Candidatus Nanopelagicales bacterium]|nr:DUF3180 domain-containing protein [Candidatus Nanopelagicales bacterium]MDZ4249728.1 DUF3180 domain-containing protein [Candidatus Nanopelagicales bacterium]
MQPTRVKVLLLVALAAAVIGWVVARVADSMLGRLMPLSWSAAVAIWLLAVGLGMWAWIVRPRLLGRDGYLPLPPVVAARTAALALAASRTGAAVGGLYAGFAVALAGELSSLAGREYAAVAVTCAIGSAALTAVGLWLEQMCRIPPQDGANGAGQSPGGEQEWEPELGAERSNSPAPARPSAHGPAGDAVG